ncbi:DHA1 family chloramphenicol resistance protein-like MFS transporter [Microbacterium foliorum]|uniref:DHA1 family chloramphenicol resistance protein-like MFS transporter n=1 Tax=Microbacterium foliorum TaxID=104336 RepID=A0ABU1HUK3_9MICO|nr:Cmx/CmrA family chloramphenicol efflux MFS transporter [Microbacterium foliorum]MDR6143728.1 DHA1 family chloramphenicol resistance protein-like MFS transporter [Microbacterium foliorum]
MPFVIVLLAVAVFAQGTSEFMLAGLLPAIASDLAVSIPQAGLLTSAFAVGMIVGAPLMAIVSRRWSPRLALSAFLLVFIAMHVLGASTDDFGVLFVTRMVAAITNAGFLAVTLSTVSALVPADRTARALSVILGGTTLALIAGVPAGAAVGALLDWRAALWGVAVISVPALVAVLLATPTRSIGTKRSTTLKDELGSLRRPALLVPLGLGALVNGATFCAFTYLAPVVTESAGLPDAAVPAALVMFGVGSSVGVWVAGRYGDRHAARILTVGGVALLIGWGAFATLSAIPVALFAFAFVQGALSFAVGSTLIASSIRAAANAPTMSGSFATASLNVGAAAGPALGGMAYATAAGATGPLLVSAALLCAAAPMFTAMRGLAKRDDLRDDRSGEIS